MGVEDKISAIDHPWSGCEGAEEEPSDGVKTLFVATVVQEESLDDVASRRRG